MQQEMNLFDLAIQAALEDAFEWHSGDYPHETQSSYVPYGDTYVNAGDQPTDESEERCLNDFRENLDVDSFVREFLLENDDFRQYIRQKIETFGTAR